MRFLYFIFSGVLFLLLLPTAHAQSGGKITGRVKDSLGIAHASISLLKTGESKPVQMLLSSAEGLFEFAGLAAGYYVVEVSAVGFQPYKSAPIALSAGLMTKQLAIQLTQAANQSLANVSVSARRPMMERKADRTIVHVDRMMSSTGSDAYQLLEQIPGIVVTEEGGVSLNGKGGVLFLIDGKQTYLTGDALINYLRSLPASALDKLELMPTPPAGFDAAGTGGVINIRTKKSALKGFNGNVSGAVNQGILFSTTNSANLNYKAGKLNVFGTFSFITGNRLTDLDIHRNYHDAAYSPTHSFLQNSYIRRKNKASSARVGLDYALDNRTSVGVVFNGLYRPSDQHTRNQSIIQQPNGLIDSTTEADNNEADIWKNHSLNVNFRKELNSSGRTLAADVDYLSYYSNVNQQFSNLTKKQGASTQDHLQGLLPSDIAIVAAKVDYTQAWNGWQMETGAKASYTTTHNLADYRIVEGGTTKPDFDKSNDFKYKEGIQAAYLSLGKGGERVTFKAGLRAERTLSEGYQKGNAVKQDSAFSRSYTNLFPTAFLSYKLDTVDRHQLTFSFGRRIERPFYQDLNPYVTPLDKFTLYVGNPYLKPSFAYDFSMAHTFKKWLTTTVSYNLITDAFMEAISLNGNHYLSKTDNLGRNRFLNLSVNATLNPAKWWNTTIYAEGGDRKYTGRLYNDFMDTSAVYGFININNQFQLGGNWSAEWSGNYRTGILVGQVSLGAIAQMNLGLQKKIWQKKGTLRLSVRDVFYSSIRNGAIHFLPGAGATFRNRGDSRVFTLGFSYNFGSGNTANKQRSGGSAETEQSRVRG